MFGGVLYEVVEEAIGVSHDGRRDPRWYEILDYTSEDDVREDSSGHDRETSLLKAQNFHATIAEQQDIRTVVPKCGRVGNRLENVAEHVRYC